MELNLKKFITDFLSRCKQYNKKLQKRYGDYFLQPTTKTQLIRCDYFVQIKPEYNVTCLCCSSVPKVSLPITLAVAEEQEIPIIFEEAETFKGPFPGEHFEHEVRNLVNSGD